MMKRWLVVILLLEQTGLAIPPRPVEHPWADAVNAAKTELATCVRNGEAKHLVGDVVIKLDPRPNQWTTSPSKSLGAAGGKLAACARDAIRKHYARRHPQYVDGFEDLGSRYTMMIGKATALLPPASVLLPAWRAALTGSKDDRAKFAKLLPPDYTIAKRCIKTDREYAAPFEPPWLQTMTIVPRFWQETVAKLVGYSSWLTAWTGTELVTDSSNGLCLEPFDRTAARAAFDQVGTCWAGVPVDVLTNPHVEFATDHSYTQV